MRQRTSTPYDRSLSSQNGEDFVPGASCTAALRLASTHKFANPDMRSNFIPARLQLDWLCRKLLRQPARDVPLFVVRSSRRTPSAAGRRCRGWVFVLQTGRSAFSFSPDAPRAPFDPIRPTRLGLIASG